KTILLSDSIRKHTVKYSISSFPTRRSSDLDRDGSRSSDALPAPIPRPHPTGDDPRSEGRRRGDGARHGQASAEPAHAQPPGPCRSEEHTSELESLAYLVCRLRLGKKTGTI